jgi:choline dehydrogenase-like flavoprotein
MAHTSLQLWGEFEEEVRPYKGIPAALISEDMHRPNNVTFAGGYLLQSIGIMPVTYASQLARATGLWGDALQDRMFNYNHAAGINMHGDCLTYDDNYLELSNEPDDRGLQKPVIYFTNHENEMQMQDHAGKIMRKIWEAAGAFNIWEYPRNSHTLGTCRMGDNPETAVVNSFGRCFDITNLYISDGSVFTSSLSVNPALTIMAISLRSADHFIQNLKPGNHSL